MYPYCDEEPCRRGNRRNVHYEVTNYCDGSCNVNICLEGITNEQAEKLLLNVIEKFGSKPKKNFDRPEIEME